MNLAKLLPIVMKLGEYLKLGVDHYATLKSVPSESRVDILTAFLSMKLEGWHPDVNGKPLLDSATREAAARFLAGVAINLSN